MTDMQKRTWAQVSLANILHNYRAMRERMEPGCKFLGVVKTNAYGHGAVPVARCLEEAGCDYFAAAMPEEAVTLRENGVRTPILILGYSDPDYTETLIRYHITQAVGDLAYAEELSRRAASLGGTLKIHLQADSGMGRFGYTCHEGESPAKALAAIMALPNLETEGIFTHFAVSDEPEQAAYTAMQYESFRRLIGELEDITGRKLDICHCANSGAMVNYKETFMDMVRPGIALYGLYPGKETGGLDLRPAMEIKSRIVQVKDFAPGKSVGYGRTYIAPSPKRIAIIPMGYGDGLHRALSNNMEVLLHGKRVPQVGRICMDMCMIDVTGVPEARVGDVVTVIGRDGEEFISADELAERAGTISYELLCTLSARVPRVYL